MTLLKRISGISWQYGGEQPSGWLPAGAARPLPTPVVRVTLDLEIHSEGDGFLLVYKAREDEAFQNDWRFESLAQAEESAEEWFGARRDQWQVPQPPPMTMVARDLLTQIRTVCEEGKKLLPARLIDASLAGGDERLRSFLESNELWGGSGSIADQACIESPSARAHVEDLLIRLGRLQLDAGVTNVRTEGWVEAFERWQRGGLRPRGA